MASVRRSRRLASQEPEETGEYNISPLRRAKSTAKFDVERAIDRRLAGDRQFIYKLTKPQRKAVIDGLANRNTRLESRIEELEERVTEATSERDRAIADAGRKRSLQQAAAQERIQRQMAQRRAAEASQTQQTAPEQPERPSTSPEPSTPSRSAHREQEPEPEQARPTTPPATSTPANTGTQQEQALTITTTSATPPALASTPAVPGWRKLINNAAGFLSPFGRRALPPAQPVAQIGDRKRSAPEDEEEHTPKRARTEEQPKRARIAEPPVTATQQTQQTPSQKRMPAKVPQSAPAAQKQASTSLGELTPASRKRSAPSESSTPKPAKTPHLFIGPSSKNPKVPTSLSTITEYSETSRLSIMPESTPAPMSTPSRLPNKRRTIAEIRASRLLGAGTPRNQPYSWERTSSTTTAPRPTELNADRRFAKLERMRKLERELQDLKQDDDIVEMESHRRKRVKVDDLVYVPHNRPGDSEGTFRVPEPDSDDEMEVEYDVPERTNVFEEASHIVEEPKAQEEIVREEAPAVSQWNFPSVGKRAADDICSAEESERCRLLFVEGFTAWKLLHGY